MAAHARPLRICLTGPECTGKTTLAERLARELGVAWVPEFARQHAETCGHVLSADDVEPIARGEMADLDRAKGDLVLLDTDLLSTVVYARYYYGACPAWIEAEALRRRAGLYLLLDTDLPWTTDPARDPSDASREDLFDAFRATLDEFETHWQIISGVGEERWERVREAVERFRTDNPDQDVMT
ncbi:MAG: ATP-binding protein [Acidobacteriota bacterium]